MSAALFSVDLGKWECGVAAFDRSGELRGAAEVVIPHMASYRAERMAQKVMNWAVNYAPDPRACRWVCEEMMDYPGKLARGTSLDDLRAVAYALRQQYGLIITEWKARKWKGQVKKPVIFHRVLNLLTSNEQGRIVLRRGQSLNPRHGVQPKEALDAVGLGLVAIDRAGRGVTRLPHNGDRNGLA